MSANNQWFYAKAGKKYYGWDEMAEESVADHDDHECEDELTCTEGKRAVKISQAIASSRSKGQLHRLMIQKSALGYAEYGYSDWPYLSKDGTPIKVIDDTKERKSTK